MSPKRIIYSNWIVDHGYDPYKIIEFPEQIAIPNEKIIREVRFAVARLSDVEQFVIKEYYYEGRSCPEIAESLFRKTRSVEQIRRRALARLRKYLIRFVIDYFKLSVEPPPDCIICKSPFRETIDKIISAKSESETWSGIIKQLKTEFDLKITTPQILIGHQKYHLIKGEQND